MEGNGSQHVVDQTPSLGDRPFFIAVHVGVGHHSAQREKAYKSVMRQACRQAAQELHLSGDPLKAVVAAVSSLEDAPLGNAGVGSNLTVKGVVQCDASTMAGDGAFGAVGAVSGVENPVRVAGELARQSREPMALGRVRPMFLAGDGAREWAKEQGLPAAPSAEAASQWHINGAAQRRWQRYKRMIDEAVQSREAPSNPAGIHKKLPSLQMYLVPDIVCTSQAGRVAASVSSGGIAMKTDGRVGEAAMFGCGCWAADSHSGRPAVACSVTGVGEAIMRAGLARACADSLRADAAAAASPDLSAASTVDAVCAQEIRDRIELGQPAGLACPHQDCGVLAVRVSRSAAAIAGGRGGAGGGAGGADGGRAGEPREVPREVHERSHLPGGASGGAGGAGGPGEPWGIQERNCCSAVTAGGGVVDALLSADDKNVRAITRNATSQKAKDLVARGVGVVEADLSNKSSLIKAFTGADMLFLVTDYYASMSYDTELQQGKNAVDAAKEAGIGFVVFSTLEDIPEDAKKGLPTLHDGRKIAHFESKAAVAEYLAQSGLPYGLLLTSAFYENSINFFFYQKQPDGSYVFSDNLGTDPHSWHSVGTIGLTAAAVMDDPQKHQGKTIPIVGERISFPQITQILSDVTGKTIRYQPISDEQYASLPFPGAADIANMFHYYRGWSQYDDLRPYSDPVVRGQKFKEWAEAHKDALKKRLEAASDAQSA
ncbi:N-terminal nucleophile aminohydrolase [Coccomyxa subellipsoidea C-169]|uniref:N-terminal nucleophile aminohydrolase n=1 Tax=Coccomyxa subellipsoidea (strain C-169) TaxID=574566 RepID=I0YMG2_COCSC|nr:N-terminal nucleophile aminohydrolase [Coccomyxa subellipsoidea C-169]EIE19581.1 N-terminal nucleophile aminohydrolase [Coccomyxa subellipsoidea C-169]|eukprot:XP_005644125.1 N-terminal nucleophile aminohydrolase [Coccomyxa subellipsoidea C-169]